MRWLARRIVRALFKDVIGSNLPQVRAAESDIPPQYWPPLPLFPKWLAERLIGRWTNLLDTTPLRNTLLERMHFDAQKIADSSKALLIAATNVRTGARMIFSNRHVTRRSTGGERDDVKYGIDVNRIVASCSIPLIYPWTYDPETNAHYWDGAVVSNTPLGAALDVIQDQPAEIPAEVVVVLMTPWREEKDNRSAGRAELPNSFGEAITWTLDWALLASFRESLNAIKGGNRLAEQERKHSQPPYQYRHVDVKIVAPEKFMTANRIIDYETQATKDLIADGYAAAKKIMG
jgi:predicted acylesterase/phospholipase RssA